MSENENSNTNSTETQEKLTEKEINFRKQAAMYERMLAEQAEKVAQLEEKINASSKPQEDDDEDDEDDGDSYIEKRKLNKKLKKFSEKTKQMTQLEIQKAVQDAMRKKEEEERTKSQQRWLDEHDDFRDVMQHAGKLAAVDPELAETILSMPDTFERRKLVYKNIKMAGLHKSEEESIQDKINANRKYPGYQPSGVATNPYSVMGDYSISGQRKAYEKLMELKSKLSG